MDWHSPVPGIQQLIECLQHKMKEVQSLAAETLSHLVTFRLAHSTFRRGGGIKHLVRNVIKVTVQLWWLGRNTKRLVCRSPRISLVRQVTDRTLTKAIRYLFPKNCGSNMFVSLIQLAIDQFSIEFQCVSALYGNSWQSALLTKLNCNWYLFQVNIIQPENKKRGRPPPKDEEDFQLTCNACKALWSCSKNQKNIQAIRAAGAVPILASLLVRGADDVILPAMGIIQECASEVWRLWW